MKNILFIVCAFVFTLGANASQKPKEKLGGGMILGVARMMGETPRLVIYTCDKSKKVCLYILKKIDDDSEDLCRVEEPWPVPPVAEQQFNPNYPFAFAFDTDVLTFYPATSIKIGCRDENDDVQISIETEADVELP